MRKLIFALVVLVFTLPALADVQIIVTDEGGGTASISYIADVNVSGFALSVQVDAGNITDVTSEVVGESVTGNKGYGIFPGTIDVNANTGLVDDNGTPVASDLDPDNPGQVPGPNVVLEFGALYVDGNEPNFVSGKLCTITVDTDCNLCVTANALRGKIVTTAGVSVDSNPTQACATIIVAAEECLASGDPGYSYWKAEFNSVSCWCYKKQCRGDSNGSLGFGKPVTIADLTNFKAAFGQTVLVLQTGVGGDLLKDTNGVYAICADYNHTKGFGKPVTIADLTIFKAYFGVADASVPQCDAPPVITGPYNFWTN